MLSLLQPCRTESRHHYSLISLRDFTISLQFPQYLDITPVSVTGTCQSHFMQLRTVGLICKLNESPETHQGELPQAGLLGMLSRGAQQPVLTLLPTLSALHCMQTGMYHEKKVCYCFSLLSMRDHSAHVLLSSPVPCPLAELL